ncbi:MAG TPA: hypothetical protein VHT02_03135, partial [Methylocella sp.]|nr:hypothetical protein [Methylocella sp.]
LFFSIDTQTTESNPACNFARSVDNPQSSTKRTVRAFMSAVGHNAKFKLTRAIKLAQLGS